MKTTTTATGFNIYQEVTKRIVMALAQGEIPWRRKWCSPMNENETVNHMTGKPYSFLNRMLLGRPGRYLGFSQIKSLGGHVKKGARGNMVVFYKMFIPSADKKKAEEMEQRGESIEHLKIPVLKYSTVFHLDDVEGIKLPEADQKHIDARRPTDVADYVMEDYSQNSGVRVDEKLCDDFSYDSVTDTVTIPARTQFHSDEQWYNTVFAGLVKSTAKEDRCNRKAFKDNPRKEDVVREELICEMGASMVMTGVGLDCEEAFEDTTAECAYWIEEFNKDFRLVINASSQAEKAARLILKPLIADE